MWLEASQWTCDMWPEASQQLDGLTVAQKEDFLSSPREKMWAATPSTSCLLTQHTAVMLSVWGSVGETMFPSQRVLELPECMGESLEFQRVYVTGHEILQSWPRGCQRGHMCSPSHHRSICVQVLLGGRSVIGTSWESHSILIHWLVDAWNHWPNNICRSQGWQGWDQQSLKSCWNLCLWRNTGVKGSIWHRSYANSLAVVQSLWSKEDRTAGAECHGGLERPTIAWCWRLFLGTQTVARAWGWISPCWE